MCISVNEARFDNTTIYSAEVRHPDKGLVHVIGYQNSVRAYGPNAMLLPFPAEGVVTRDNLVNGAQFKTILKSYNEAVERFKPRPKSVSRGFGSNYLGAGPAAAAFEVFESGSYTIALVQKPSALGLALKDVREDRRPELPYRFLLSLTQLYPDWPMALCCFNRSMEQAEPLFWWYKPRFPSVLFAPAIDAHDGNPPKLDALVHREHTLAFASYASTRNPDTTLQAEINNLVPSAHRWMFDARVCGRELNEITGNGDFVVPVNHVRDSKHPAWLNVEASLPPTSAPSAWEKLLSAPLV